MKTRYDPKVDARLVRLTKAPIDAPEEIRPGLIIEFDKDGRIGGFGILDTRDALSKGTDLLKAFDVAA